MTFDLPRRQKLRDDVPKSSSEMSSCSVSQELTQLWGHKRPQSCWGSTCAETTRRNHGAVASRKSSFPAAAHHLPLWEVPNAGSCIYCTVAIETTSHQMVLRDAAQQVRWLCWIAWITSAGCFCAFWNNRVPFKDGRLVFNDKSCVRDNLQAKHTIDKGWPYLFIKMSALWQGRVGNLFFFFNPFFSLMCPAWIFFHFFFFKTWLWGHFWSLGQRCWGRQTICWIFALRPSGKQQLCVASSRTASWLCKWAENFRKVCACLWCIGHFFVKGPVNIFTPNFSFDEP